MLTAEFIKAIHSKAPDPLTDRILTTRMVFKSWEPESLNELLHVGSLKTIDVSPLSSMKPHTPLGSSNIHCTISPGTGTSSDMIYTPCGMLAVARGSENNVVLYGDKGKVVKESVMLRNPTGIAYYAAERALAVMENGTGNIVLLDAEDLHFVRTVAINEEVNGNGHRVAVCGADFLSHG